MNQANIAPNMTKFLCLAALVVSSCPLHGLKHATPPLTDMLINKDQLVKVQAC